MTANVEALGAAAPLRRPGSTVRLGLSEGRRLLRSPLVLAGLAISATFLYGPEFILGTAEDLPYVVWTGIVVYPIGAGALLAGMLAVLRSRRHHTDELYDTTPTGAAQRTLAHLLAALGPVVLALASLAAAAVLHELWDGITVRYADGVRLVVPGPLELAQGPAVVLVLGVLGVAVARWLPSLASLPFLAVALLFHFVTGSWGVGGTFRWFLPYVNHEVTRAWVQVDASSGYGIVDHLQTAALHWHVAYLIGLTVVLGAVAVARHRRDLPVLLTGAAGLAVAVTAGVLQLP